MLEDIYFTELNILKG